jgi:uncharacterized protein (DUF1786 family)
MLDERGLTTPDRKRSNRLAWALQSYNRRMRVLAIDVGTGTQDILLFDSEEPIENALQLIMPSPTQIAAGRIRRATASKRAVALNGTIAGGGPCHWALEDHLRAGLPAFATREAGMTFDDEPSNVEAMGVTLVSEDELSLVDADRVELRDLDLGAIRAALAAFDVAGDFDGLALGCLDHGAAPAGYSDRLFRFDHLRRVVQRRNDLRAFAYLPEEVPGYLTRAHSLLASVDVRVPTVFLDTGPAAALGALQDENVGAREEQVVLNLGNMHALCFHLRGTEIVSLWEHHTGEVTAAQIEDFTRRLVEGSLQHEEVFGSKGHGVFYVRREDGRGKREGPLVAVTGPQRGKLRGSSLKPYFAVPHGDMMVSGCFGLLWAFAERHPETAERILSALGVN